MPTAAELNLKGNVRSVETYRFHISTKSYRLLPGGNRELLQDFDPIATTEPSPSLFSLERLDEQGRVIEDVDVDRPLIDQEAYKRLYTYNDFGRLAEIVDYDENNHVENTWRYAYSADEKKVSEEGWSATGHLWTRSEFDEHENRVRLTWFRDDGAPEREQNWRYQYSGEGNVTEQLLVPPDEPQMTYRSVFIRDLRISRFDSYGRELQISISMPAGFLSSRGTDDVTTFAYDLHGNLIEIDTTASDGTLRRKVTSAYRYDEKGNWVERTEVELNQTWQTEPFPASFETIRRFTRKLDYFNA
jgi:YD repeat-containing protein